MACSQKQGWPVWVGNEKVKCAFLINTLLVQVAQELVFILLPSELRPSIPDCEVTNFPLIQTQATRISAATEARQETASPADDWGTRITKV